ncbi:MAG: glutamate formimidoyltransferase, partial [Longimicrobiales bacterium]
MVQLVETVPNFSEGRDGLFVQEAVAVFIEAGAEVLDASLDPDHHRSVITAIGSPDRVVEGSVRVAALAQARIDMRGHSGVHPRIGALDVLPFVPLVGITDVEVASLAQEAARRISDQGVPVVLYGKAAPVGAPALSSLRKGGFEGRVRTPPIGPPADFEGRANDGSVAHSHAHPTAGTTCIGVRKVLLAWNVDVMGIPHA